MKKSIEEEIQHIDAEIDDLQAEIGKKESEIAEYERERKELEEKLSRITLGTNHPERTKTEKCPRCRYEQTLLLAEHIHLCCPMCGFCELQAEGYDSCGHFSEAV